MSRRYVQTVEQTGKGIKFLQLLCILATIIGFVGSVLTWPDDNARIRDQSPTVGIFLLTFIGGLVGFIIMRIVAWWYHG